MNGKGKTRCCGRVPTNDYGDGHGNEEAQVAHLGSGSLVSFVATLESLKVGDYPVLNQTTRIEEHTKLDCIGSWGVPMEVVDKDAMCMNTNTYGI